MPSPLASTEVLWTRLLASVNDIGTMIRRTSFSPIVNEGLDYSAGLFDSSGAMLVQADAAAAGHIGSMPYVARNYLETVAVDSLRPGDVLVTNDPWLGAGQTNDIYTATPVFFKSRVVGIIVCSQHLLDIGGRVACTESTQVYEEGLRIPIMKLFDTGKPNETLFELMKSNVRMPDRVVADLMAQVAAADQGARRVAAIMAEYGLSELVTLTTEIVNRTAAAMCERIARLPQGNYHAETELEEFSDDDKPLRIALAINLDGKGVHLDFAGSSPQVRRPINSVLNYTRAYAVLGVKLALHPFLPNNGGTYSRFFVDAPLGSIVNCAFPAPVHFRHVIGMRIPELVFEALAPVLGETVPAGSGGVPQWQWTLSGTDKEGRDFICPSAAFGGLGGSKGRDGMSSVSFPANIRDVPVEVVESQTPVLIERRELLAHPVGNGGGAFRGGFGEELVFAHIGGTGDPPITLSVIPGRMKFRAHGLYGGEASALGSVLLNDVLVNADSGCEFLLRAGDRVTLRVPGGAGYGEASAREAALVEADVVDGYITQAVADTTYAPAHAKRAGKAA